MKAKTNIPKLCILFWHQQSRMSSICVSLFSLINVRRIQFDPILRDRAFVAELTDGGAWKTTTVMHKLFKRSNIDESHFRWKVGVVKKCNART